MTAWVSRWIAERAEVLRRFPDSARQFLPDGRPPAPGERWAAPDLARSLRAVATDGAETFYRGELAERVLAFLRREGALFDPADFARQLGETFVQPAIATDYRGFQVYATAPVSQGFLILSQLNVLEGFDLRGLPLVGTDRIHLTVEAKKLAFEDRNRHAGDPAFVRWPLAQLIGKDHAARRRAEIDLGPRAPARGSPRPGARRRHQLLRRRRRGRQRGLVHPQPVGGVRLGRRRRGHRDHAEQPGRPRVLAGRGAPERHRSGQADDAHAERLSRLPGRAAVAGRRDAGRRPADPVEHPGDHQHDRPRALAAGGRGSAALVQLPRDRPREPRAPGGRAGRGPRPRVGPARARGSRTRRRDARPLGRRRRRPADPGRLSRAVSCAGEATRGRAASRSASSSAPAGTPNGTRSMAAPARVWSA